LIFDRVIILQNKKLAFLPLSIVTVFS